MDNKIPKKDTGIFFSCTKELKEKLRERALENGRTMSGETGYLIKCALERETSE